MIVIIRKSFMLLCISSIIFAKNQFMGLVESSSVNKNNFLCPLSFNASGNVVCNDMDVGMIGFDLSGGQTIQIFNNQLYWLQQKFERQNLLMVRGYKGDRLSSTMTQEGWDHVGAFSIIISTDSIMGKAVEPEKVAASEQVKLIVQLWYSSSTGLQLWAQDVVLLNAGQNFKILVSHDQSKSFQGDMSVISSDQSPKNIVSLPNLSNKLPNLSAGQISKSVVTAQAQTHKITETSLDNFKKQFLEQVDFAPNYIDKNVYQSAFGSPRSIQIQIE